jgi:hemerythrin-like domain-containing protein
MDAAAWATELLRGLARVHAVLRRSLETILRVSAEPVAEGDRAGFAEFTDRFARFLEVHHDGEEEIVFPALTAGAAKVSLDGPAASVDGFRADHERLLVRLAALKAACAQFRGGGPAEPVRAAALEVRELLIPHLDAEETKIDAAVVEKILSKDEAMAMFEAAAKHGQQHGGPKSLMMFVHALTDEEQRAHFGPLPWFVRKILMKRVWERDFRPCLKFAHNQSVAL